jgi:hypothetical protein
LQFGNTANFQNAPEEPPETEDPGSQAQEVSALQFGNTANFQNAPEEPPVVEQQPAPAPAPPYDPATSIPQQDANANGVPGEYGDGPDLDANGIPDEIGINPDMLQAGYPDSSTSGDWGGVGVPDESGGIDPYALQQPAYPDSPSSSSTSGDGTGDPYGGSSFEPYVPPEEAPLEEEAPVAEGEDPDALASF